MTLLIGTDEAGYGPNLGPLVVAATAWRVDTPAEDAETVLTTAMLEVDAATGAGRGTPLWPTPNRSIVVAPASTDSSAAS